MLKGKARQFYIVLGALLFNIHPTNYCKKRQNSLNNGNISHL